MLQLTWYCFWQNIASEMQTLFSIITLINWIRYPLQFTPYLFSCNDEFLLWERSASLFFFSFLFQRVLLEELFGTRCCTNIFFSLFQGTIYTHRDILYTNTHTHSSFLMKPDEMSQHFYSPTWTQLNINTQHPSLLVILLFPSPRSPWRQVEFACNSRCNANFRQMQNMSSAAWGDIGFQRESIFEFMLLSSSQNIAQLCATALPWLFLLFTTKG